MKDLSVARGGLRVLEGLSFSAAPGTALVLRGPNGIGKTTVLRTLAGLQPALAGQVSLPEDQMAYAGHADGLKSALSVTENLSFWANTYGGAGIEAAIDAFDLDALRTRAAGQLSAGQKRRLGLARLLVTGRPIWLLDEPTVSLDAATVAQFARVIETHLVGGGIALMATHIDLGLSKAEVLDLTPFKATAREIEDFDEAFL